MENKTFIKTIIESLVAFLSKNTKAAEKVQEVVVKAVSGETKPIEVQVLDWNNPKSHISKYFTVEDAIMLREWKRLANAEDGLNDTAKKNLIGIFEKMDVIREFLGMPVFVKSAYRPSAYNVAIGGAALSAHMASNDYAAVDFWCDADGDGDKDGDDCDLIKEKIMPMIEGWNLRMEDNGKGARWIHVDDKPVGPGMHRFFKP